MTDQELRALDAKVHEAWTGEKPEPSRRNGGAGGPFHISERGLRAPIPCYTKDLAAAWTLDRAGWLWESNECVLVNGLPIVEMRLWIPDKDGLHQVKSRVQIESGDKPRAYCIARVKCVLQALEVKDDDAH